MVTMKTSYKSKRKKGYKTCKKRSKLIFKTTKSTTLACPTLKYKLGTRAVVKID